MGYAVNASQPSSLAGTAGATAVSLSAHLLEFLVSENAETFAGRDTNKKYAQDGGLLTVTQSATFQITDVSQRTHFQAGKLWRNLAATYASEGASANSGNYGTLTITLARARVNACSPVDIGGRLALSGGMDVYSTDGNTNGVSYAVA